MVSKKTKQLVIERDRKCMKCGATGELTVDHIVPLSKGGTNAPMNLQAMCSLCNQRKGNRSSWLWWERIIMALHVEEIVTRTHNDLSGRIAGQWGTMRQEINSKADEKLAQALRVCDSQQQQIAALSTKIAALEKHLKIAYVVETTEFRGYRKAP